MGEYGQPSSPPDLHAEEEPKEHSTQDRNAPEELHAEVEKEIQPIHGGSTMGERSDAEQEQSVPIQTTPEEILEEGEAKKEVTQGIIEPAGFLALSNSSRVTKKPHKEKTRELIEKMVQGAMNSLLFLLRKMRKLRG